MIDFACKRFEMSEVIKCSLALSKAEFKLFDFFIKNDLLTEGTETMVMSILFQGITESTVAVNINDTSIDPLTASPVTITEGNSFDVTYTNPEAGNTVKIYTLTGPGITLSDIQSVKQTFTVTTSGGKYLLNGV